MAKRTRGHFKKGFASILAMLLVLLGISGCSSNTVGTRATQSAGLPDKWDYEADVIVVGYGAAGIGAAKAAIEEGSSVLVLEKEPPETAGGASRCNGGTILPTSAESYFNSARGHITRGTADRLFAETEAAKEWVIGSGAQLGGIVVKGGGPAFYDVILKGVGQYHIDVLYETPATQLIQNPATNEIVGVIATDKKGKELHIRANKGVVLCTGGYSQNPEMVEKLMLSSTNAVGMSAPSITGDGLKMALKAGAMLSGLNWQGIEWGGIAFRKASEEMGTGIVYRPKMGFIDSKIYVNGAGKRFMDENMQLIHYKGNIPFLQFDGDYRGYSGYRNLPMYLILDSKAAASGSVGMIKGGGASWATNMGVYDNWSANNQVELKKGWLVSANTIEELAEKLAKSSGQNKIDPKALKNTVDAYNAACAKKEDMEFGRGKDSLIPLDSAPYYAAEMVPAILYTIGGLRGGPNGETLDWNGNPIPRLYHAGDVGQPMELTPLGIVGSIAAGSVAGRAVSHLESH